MTVPELMEVVETAAVDVARAAEQTGVHMYASDVVDLVERRLPGALVLPMLGEHDSRRDLLARVVVDVLIDAGATP